MRIAINNSPLKTEHKFRGIGNYTNNLLQCFKKERDIEVVEFTNLSDVKDVELVHYPWFDFYFHTLPIKKKFRTVVTIHDTIPLIFPQHFPVGIKGKINLILQKLALRNTKLVITDSEVSKIDIIKFLNVDKNKVVVIPLASDTDFKVLNDSKLLHIKRKYNIPDKFLLYVGDVNWTKNIPFLINGFFKLTQNPDLKDLKLVLVGAAFLKNVEQIEHPELRSLKEVNILIKRLDLERKVMRVGKLEKQDLVGFYNLATVYIQPSIYEGFGLSVLEALSCGTPVISSSGGSLQEVGGNASLYFDPENLSQFIKVTTRVILDKLLLQKMSDLAIKQALKFSWNEVGDQTKEAYFEVIKDK